MTKNVPAVVEGETLEAKAIEAIGGGAQAVMLAGQTFDVVNQVNLPTLKHETGETIAIEITDAIREEVNYKDVIKTIDGEKKMVREENIINVGRVRELNSGQMFEYVYNAMTADNLRGAYPDQTYLGRFFAIQKLGVVQGKQYKQTNIVEIKPREAQPTAA
jgi:hypothetical protein